MSELIQVTTNTTGTRTTVTVNYRYTDGSYENEVVQLNKEADNWNLISKVLLDESHFNLNSPKEAHFLVEGLTLILKVNGDLFLSGQYGGSLLMCHSGKVVIDKDHNLKIGQNFFLNEVSLFENCGMLEVGKNCLCLLKSIRNSGTIVVKQGWQILAAQKIDNTTSGKISVLRCDVVSNSTKMNNNGELNCIMDFNGASCDFINQAGNVHIGGNCSLRTLTDKSENEPTIGGYGEIGRKLVDQGGNEIHPGDARHFLLYYQGELKCDPKDSCNPGNFQEWLHNISVGCARIITNAQTFTRREGKRSSFYVQGHLKLIQSSVVECSSVWASSFEGDIQLRGYATMRQMLRYVVRNTHNQYCKGNFFGGGGRTVHYDNFIHEGTQTEMNEFIPSTFEVLGEVTGNVETFVNGGANSAQSGVVRTTEEALTQLRDKIQAISTESHIFPVLDEKYEEELNELKADPGFATMIRRQEMRRERSEMSSTAPSRCDSPEINERDLDHNPNHVVVAEAIVG